MRNFVTLIEICMHLIRVNPGHTPSRMGFDQCTLFRKRNNFWQKFFFGLVQDRFCIEENDFRFFEARSGYSRKGRLKNRRPL